MGARWRLLRDGPGDGAWNMALDEALLESYAGETSPPAPTLRLYGWHPPTLSLGSRQPAAGTHDDRFLRSEGIALVRRPTGGGAVLHEHERTYAVVGRLRVDPFPGGVLDTYRRVSDALADGFRRLGIEVQAAAAGPGAAPGPYGPPICFDGASAHEITVGGRKLVGSAQLRRRRAFLQHGSILVRVDPRRLGDAVGVAARPGRMVDLQSVLGRPPADSDIDEAIIAGFESVFGARLEETAPTPDERLLATRLRCWKYLSVSWTLDARRAVRDAAPTPGGTDQ